MKKITRFLYLCLLMGSTSLWAQSPQGVNFQAVARDASGVPIAFKAMEIQFTILDAGNTVIYQEAHKTNTDDYGLFKLVMGGGKPSQGTFGKIDWSKGPFKVALAMDEGAGLVKLGTYDLQSVPYALYAEKTNMEIADLNDVDLTGISPGQSLQWDGTEWKPGNAGESIWSQNDATAFYNAGRVGIGVDTPMTTLHVADTSNVLWGKSLTGSGYKFLWYGAKGAMRFGYLNNPFGGYNYDKFWDYDSVGFYSFAGGQNARAKGFGAFAFGSFGWADGSGSVAFFGRAEGNNSFTFGGSSKGRGSVTFEGVADGEGGIAMYGYAGGRYSVSIGGGTTGLGASSAREDYSIALGWNSDARGQASIAMGPSDAYGYNSFSTGWVTEARGNYSFTMGLHTNSYSYASLALGRFNVITGDSATWRTTDPILSIGDGTSANNRSNSFTILKNGQTSIGYNSPTGMLHVSSALGSLNNGGSLDPTHASLLIGSPTSGMAFDPNQIETIGTTLNLNFNSNRDIAMVAGGGDVAIGHGAPAAKLDIESTGWHQRIENTAAGGGAWYLGASSSAWAAGGGKYLIGNTANSSNAAFAIDGDRQVGIGVINPTDRLHVNSAVGEDAMLVQVSGTTALRVHDNLGTSIGAISTPPQNGLRVAGEARFDSDIYPSTDKVLNLGKPTNRWNIVWATNGAIQTSDLRLKTGIQLLGYGLAEILALRPVSYFWKEQPNGARKVGLIAQEVQQVLPEVVADPGEDQPLGVNYAEMVPVLIKAVQEQQETIENLSDQLSKMQAELANLKQMIHANSTNHDSE